MAAWRNGRRSGLKIRRPAGRGSSSLPAATRKRLLKFLRDDMAKILRKHGPGTLPTLGTKRAIIYVENMR